MSSSTVLKYHDSAAWWEGPVQLKHSFLFARILLRSSDVLTVGQVVDL